MRLFFFGVANKGEVGHDLFEILSPETMQYVRRAGQPPILHPGNLDGRMTPPVNVQGAARLTRLGPYTVLSWHDYTGDSRPGSNSNFIAEGAWTFAEMLMLWKMRGPTSVVGRQPPPFEVIE